MSARARLSLLALAGLMLLAGALTPARAASGNRVCVTDDAARRVCLAQPARRIVALSPGATELLFDAGAGARLVGAVSFSDFPAAARAIPRVGSYKRLDLERILALKPDLIVAWRSGNPTAQTERLEALGQTLYYSEPRRLDDVATTLERFARLAGSAATGNAVARAFRAGIAALATRYRKAAPVRVFYQVWEEPLMTVNDDHLISQVIHLCGGVNVFGDLPALTPRISREAVLGANPEAIVAGGMGEENTAWLGPWRAFSSLIAVQRGNLFFVPPSTLQRPTPRLLQGARTLCGHLERARERR